MATVAASDSTARSARTLRMSGWSARSFPKAVRCAQWCVACATAWRIAHAEPMTQSRRVWFTISMMVGTPRPSSPTIRAQVRSSSTSLEALERLPSLSFRRWMWNRFRVPSGRKRGRRKHESPLSACARTRKASDMGAEQNHLWPVSSYSAPGPRPASARARVAPGERVQLVGDGETQERMPGGVELDLVDAVAVAVVGTEDRRIGVRLHAPAERLAPRQLTEPPEALFRPGGALPADALRQGAVGGEQVVAFERGWLVQDLVRGHRASAYASPRPLGNLARESHVLHRHRVRGERTLSHVPAPPTTGDPDRRGLCP